MKERHRSLEFGECSNSILILSIISQSSPPEILSLEDLKYFYNI